MCNVVVFQFTCGHTLRLRRSQCKGTKHKVTRTSIKAACTAQSFLTITLRVDCGPCQHEKWETNWKLKLKRAARFLEKLTENRMIGIEEIAAQVQELERQYTSASWEAQHTFLQVHKPMLPRVSISDYKRIPSPLPHEVRPEDIVEAVTTNKAWSQMDENDYDGNYIASTDPIHPVSTDYTHPMDDDDESWVLNHLSPEELESCAADDVPFNLDGCGWNWGDDKQGGDMVISERETENGDNSTREWTACSLDTEQGLVAWGPEAEMMSSRAEISMQGLISSREPVHLEQIAETIKAFWVVVNGDPEPQKQEQHSSPNKGDEAMNHLIANLDLSDKKGSPSTTPPDPSTAATPTESLLWTDGPADTPPSPTRPSTPPAPNSTRAQYDKSRNFLKERRRTDLNARQFYSDWLLVSRFEARAFEGPEGRCVFDPPVLGGMSTRRKG